MVRTFAFGAAASQGEWPVQEDGFFADPGRGTFVVADGFGGRGAGDLAAKLALQEARSLTPERSPREGGILTPAQAAHRDLFGEINKKLLQWNEKRPPGSRGGTSLALASLDRERELTLTGCGACSAFLVREGAWLPLLAAQAFPRDSLSAPLVPSQALGLGRELNPESRSLTLRAGDLVLLFSGGLAWERSGFQAELVAQAAIREPGSDLSSLVALATEAASPWNQTAVAVEALV
jgi:serine/threonine protein phosphatase PrpC